MKKARSIWRISAALLKAHNHAHQHRPSLTIEDCVPSSPSNCKVKVAIHFASPCAASYQPTLAQAQRLGCNECSVNPPHPHFPERLCKQQVPGHPVRRDTSHQSGVDNGLLTYSQRGLYFFYRFEYWNCILLNLHAREIEALWIAFSVNSE